MQILSLTPDFSVQLPPLALTIGNYDGVHLGHQALLGALVAHAQQKNLKSAVMVFEPQPREFFQADNPPARLTNLSEKAALIAQCGIDYLLVARFDEAFRSLSAAQFAKLLRVLGVVDLVLGDDFRFGHDRMGDRAFLQQAGFGVDQLPSVLAAGERVSSTAIRHALAQGDLAQASQLLGRDYAITGEVVHGDQIGRTLDFPTANIALNRKKAALQGVFAADVFVLDGAAACNAPSKPSDFQAAGTPLAWQNFAKDGKTGIQGTKPHSLLGAVSVGTRPSVNGTQERLEVHLPEFAGDLYGKVLKVEFLHYLHGERHYDGLDSLKAGIDADVQHMLAWRKAQG
ncbi:riboflavin biosynthesis protein RibF [Moraxella caviae]|uniref:Riboflavin biosynthesis protein n=1 Tax=Moraxella caviae TaxID=34060 RepID=A0A1T0AAR2_9GAMM|nr:bifunctional riboflavin kinase/FAD synthetase [Moraxella caviae]OOR92826.1 riboflavin biosynthesis protein RibF [Moraxella caviae]STZ14135.1 Riboflavin biosynthesis protein ribF [Moraxella caviae]VEW10448.1 Riboflavin biosynthesis protein ribF [Moraxella caviae]